MDRATIEFNYSRALDQASKIDTTAGRLKTISDTDLKGVLQNVSAGWKGENANKYIVKGDILYGRICRVAGGLNSVASAIRAAAKTIYEAELEALRIEEERAYLARLAAEEAERKAREEEATKTVNKNSSSRGKNEA